MEEPKKIKERIKALFIWRDISFTAFAHYMTKIKKTKYSQSGLSHKLARETISFRQVIEITEALGYDIIFKPKLNWKSLDDN